MRVSGLEFRGYSAGFRVVGSATSEVARSFSRACTRLMKIYVWGFRIDSKGTLPPTIQF